MKPLIGETIDSHTIQAIFGDIQDRLEEEL